MVRICPACGKKNRIPAEHLSDTGKCGWCKGALAPVSEPIDVGEDEFDDIIRGARVPVLVDFWATWCGPCKIAAPEVAKAAHKMAGRALVLKVDTDRHPELARRYRVRGIPFFVVFKDGSVFFEQAGLVDHGQMTRWLDAAGA